MKGHLGNTVTSQLCQLMTATLLILTVGCNTVKPTRHEPTAVILKANASNYQIVLPDHADSPGTAKYLREAAQCLQQEFHQATGVTLPLRNEKDMADDQPAIFIGNTRTTAAQNLNLNQLHGFSCRIAVRNGNVFLVGNDYLAFSNKKKIRPYAYNYILGSVKAVVVFMEDYLGTRFLYPGNTGISTPRRNSLELPGNLMRTVNVPLDHSCGRPTTMMYDYAISNYGFGHYFVYGGHSYYSAVPAKRYAQTHPEYFALLGGKRVSRGNHLCISNPQVQNLIFQEMLKRLDDGAEVVELGQTDGYIPCQCDACKAYGNTTDEGEKLWILHRSLAQRLKRERPGKKVLIIAYSHTSKPPKTFTEFPDNTMIEICHYTCQSAKEWAPYSGIQGFIAYLYNWGTYKRVGLTPKNSPTACADQARMFIANQVKGIYRCGFAELCGLEGPVYYTYGKLLENPNQDLSKLLDDFYQGAFQEVAIPMKTFFETLHRRLESYCTMNGIMASPATWMREPENPRVILGFIYTPDVLDKMEKNLARAEKQATNPKVRKRLTLVRTEFDYAKHIGTIIHLYNAYRMRPSQTLFAPLADAIDARNAWIKSLSLPNGTVKTIPGWPELKRFGYGAKISALRINGRGPALLSAPFNWNTKMLRQKNILPGSSLKKMTILRADGTVKTMDFNSGAWKNATWQTLNGIQMGEIKNQTRFKIIYDDHNLHIAFETDLNDAKNFIPQGKDGPTWGTDCLEIMLDPFGNRERFYHFIYNPVQHSYFDERFGFVTDVLHPLYNKPDRGWNGLWSYENKRQNNVWRSRFTLPFKTMNVPAPTPGEHWTLNIGREAFDRLQADPELSLWSPNMETMSFHDLEAFGEAVFQ